MLRADQEPGGAIRTEPEELLTEDRDALRDEFLASPEGRAFVPDGDEAFVVSLAMTFAPTTSTDGRCAGAGRGGAVHGRLERSQYRSVTLRGRRIR